MQKTHVVADLLFQYKNMENWHNILLEEKQSQYFLKILKFIDDSRKQGKTIFPQNKDIFNAFKYCTLNDLKVVILGQDPYFSVKQAHGLAFSVPRGIPIPPSLKNIFIELSNDTGYKIPTHGCLINWSKQGVLLLNSVLTVESGIPYSHKNKGWEKFTDRVVKKISKTKCNVVFLLWGKSAQAKEILIENRKNHLILRSAHPSPLSARNGLFNCQHFSKTNEYLKKNDIDPINWELT